MCRAPRGNPDTGPGRPPTYDAGKVSHSLGGAVSVQPDATKAGRSLPRPPDRYDRSATGGRSHAAVRDRNGSLPTLPTGGGGDRRICARRRRQGPAQDCAGRPLPTRGLPGQRSSAALGLVASTPSGAIEDCRPPHPAVRQLISRKAVWKTVLRSIDYQQHSFSPYR